MPPDAESKFAMYEDSLRREIVSFLPSNKIQKGKIASVVVKSSKMSYCGLFEDKDYAMTTSDQQKHMKEKHNYQLELISSGQKSAEETPNTRPIGPWHADARLANLNETSEHYLGTTEKHGQPNPTKNTVVDDDMESYCKNSSDSAEGKTFAEVTKEKSESGVKAPSVRILRTSGKENTHTLTITRETQMQISESANKMSILSQTSTLTQKLIVLPQDF